MKEDIGYRFAYWVVFSLVVVIVLGVIVLIILRFAFNVGAPPPDAEFTVYGHHGHAGSVYNFANNEHEVYVTIDGCQTEFPNPIWASSTSDTQGTFGEDVSCPEGSATIFGTDYYSAYGDRVVITSVVTPSIPVP